MRRPLRRATAALLGGLVVAVVSVVPATGARAADLPKDPYQKGFVALCGPDRQPVTGGSTTTKPFVWTAISSQPPPSSYAGSGQNARLTIAQERPGVDPASWSSDSLTAATVYADSAYPTAQATARDLSLASILAEYPPQGDGLYQLRMSYGRIGGGIDGSGYAATTIRVVGTTWQVVAGGDVPCSKGVGTSTEVSTGVVSAAPAAGYLAEVVAARKALQDKGSASGTASNDASAGSGGQLAARAATSSAGRGRGALPIVLAVLGGVVVLGGAGALWRRRRTS